MGKCGDIGNLDAAFSHAMGDFDYGLRARNAGYEVWIMPGYAGTCRNNTADGTYQDTNLSFTKRISQMKSVKGLPPGDWTTFARRHAGPFWLVYAVSPYLRRIFSMKLRK
jgi:GT2 family glycosyltransferase